MNYCRDCCWVQHRVDSVNKSVMACNRIDWCEESEQIAQGNAGLVIRTNDDTGLECWLRVTDTFGCNKFQKKGDWV